MAADMATVNFHMVVEMLAVDLRSHRFAELVAKDEGRLVLAVDIARHLQGRNALGAVDEDADRRHEVNESHLAAGEDRAACDAELVAIA